MSELQPLDLTEIREAVLDVVRGQQTARGQLQTATAEALRNLPALQQALAAGAALNPEALTSDSGADLFMVGVSAMDGPDVLE